MATNGGGEVGVPQSTSKVHTANHCAAISPVLPQGESRQEHAVVTVLGKANRKKMASSQSLAKYFSESLRFLHVINKKACGR